MNVGINFDLRHGGVPDRRRRAPCARRQLRSPREEAVLVWHDSLGRDPLWQLPGEPLGSTRDHTVANASRADRSPSSATRSASI